MNEHTETSAIAQVSFPPAQSPEEWVGIGLRHTHYQEIIDTDLNIGFLEVHPENYFGGGAHRHFLTKAREKYQISLHAVGLSLGSIEPVSLKHLAQIKELIDIYEPFRVSDHASWSASGNAHLNDLLPLPYTEESLKVLCRNIHQTQEFFGRQILVENPSTYVAFASNTMTEAEFLNKTAEITGCGILLDVNNIYVQAHNHRINPIEYIAQINRQHVSEIHLAGHVEQMTERGSLLVDTHSQPVRDEVWALYHDAIQHLGPVHTIIEWDQDIPSLQRLVDEADNARAVIRNQPPNRCDELGTQAIG